LITAAIVAVPLCWHPVYKSCLPGTRLHARTRVLRLLKETGIIVMVGTIFAALVVFLTSRGFHFLEGWRFGLLSFTIGALIVLMIELVNLAADAAGEMGETIATALSGYFTRSKQVSPSAGHRPGEEETR